MAWLLVLFKMNKETHDEAKFTYFERYDEADIQEHLAAFKENVLYRCGDKHCELCAAHQCKARDPWHFDVNGCPSCKNQGQFNYYWKK